MAFDKRLADKILADAYEQYNSLLIKFCSVHLKNNLNAVEDCVQNSYLVFYNKILSGVDIKNKKAFLYSTALNMCKRAEEEFSKNAKRTVMLEDISDIPAIEQDLKAADLDYDVIKDILIANLSENEQRLYNMKYVDRLSLNEIGNEFGISTNTAAKRTSRLRAKIIELAEPIIEEFKRGG